MLPFIAAFIDFDSSEETFEKYDKMSAYELFQKCGVSTAAYEEFLRPTLLVVRDLLPVYMTPAGSSIGSVPCGHLESKSMQSRPLLWPLHPSADK